MKSVKAAALGAIPWRDTASRLAAGLDGVPYRFGTKLRETTFPPARLHDWRQPATDYVSPLASEGVGQCVCLPCGCQAMRLADSSPTPRRCLAAHARPPPPRAVAHPTPRQARFLDWVANSPKVRGMTSKGARH
ncbi:hypothetical protein CDD82_883 [Ophiocordyceps australis]|uniref:Uncharacterized protein n=1 Tax=Ophiocordyceps australis TaxID=1399860 RepID=A0A2C5YEW9_9HYPO|nr:hypothetical protein CDD82_883 [Ophiocordyceps australis]